MPFAPTPFGHGTVPAYELTLALGACVLVAAVAERVAQDDLPRRRAFAWLTATYLAAIGGARIAFALSWLPSWHDAFTALTRQEASGFASLGAVCAAAPVAWILARRLGLPFERLAGPLVVGGCGFGALLRVGCFLAGCCQGRPTTLPWGVAPFGHGHTAGAMAVHPWPLYEAALLVAIALALRVAARRRAVTGTAALPHTAVLVAAYLAGRFGLELLRAQPATYAGLSAAQWLCAVLLLLGAASLGTVRFAARHPFAGLAMYGRGRTAA